MNKLSQKLIKLSIAGGTVVSGLTAGTAFAQVPPGFNQTGTGLGTPQIPQIREANVEQTILVVITWGLAIAGTVAVLFLIVGGFLYITASGDETRMTKAKDTLKNAIIGTIFILLALVIVITLNQVLAQQSV